MNPSKLVSIIIPSLNRKEYIINLLNDLKKQSFQDFEIIVTDQTKEPYNLSPELCRYFHVNTKGPCISRQYAIEQSNGEILVFLDDDARINENFLYKLVNPIIALSEDATCGAICDESGNYKYIDFEQRFELNKSKKFSNDLISLLTVNPNCPQSGYTLSFPTGCAAIRREVYFEIGGIDLAFDPNGALEDRDIGFRLIKSGRKIRYCPEAKLLHMGSSTGGRRDIVSQLLYISDYDINMFYFLYKHFGEEAFNEYKLHLTYVLYKKYGLLSRHFLKSVYAIYRFSVKDLMKIKLNLKTKNNNSIEKTNFSSITVGDIST